MAATGDPTPRPGPAGSELIEAARPSPAEVVSSLQSPDSGLTTREATVRLARFGPNAIRSHGARPLEVLWRRLRNPLLILLAAATVTSLLVGQRTDAVIILAIVGLSVGLGFFNECRSERVVVLMGTSSNFGNMFGAAGGSLVLNFLPMTPTQILLNNLLYDTGEMIGRQSLRPQRPVAGWRRPRAVKRIERLASRWTARPRPPRPSAVDS